MEKRKNYGSLIKNEQPIHFPTKLGYTKKFDTIIIGKDKKVWMSLDIVLK